MRLRDSRLRVLLLFAATIAVASCDSPTQPPSAARLIKQSAKIDGDTLACGQRGWTIIQGRYECNPE